MQNLKTQSFKKIKRPSAITYFWIGCALVTVCRCSENGEVKPTPTTITYVNNTLTPLTLEINGQTSVIDPAFQEVLQGMPGETSLGTASTSGKTTSGAQVGAKRAWAIDNTFPAARN